MRILHVTHTSMPYVCGYSIRSRAIFLEQIRAGHELRVVTSPQHPWTESLLDSEDGISHRRIAPYIGPKIPGVREAHATWAIRQETRREIQEFQPHIVHAHSPMLVGSGALWAARSARTPFVYEVRDLWENAAVDRGKFSTNSPAYRLSRAVETRVLRRADAVVTICDSLAAELSGRTGDRTKLFTVPNGVDVSTFEPAAADPEFRQSHGLQDRELIGYIGSFQPYEGLQTLLRALSSILAHRPSAHLVIVGGGEGEAVLKQLALLEGVADRVTFTGRIPHHQVRALYSEMELLVYPRVSTRTTELTTPLKPLEAMSMEKPVLASSVAAIREIVHDGQTGRLFSPGSSSDLAQKAVELLQDRDERSRLARAAALWVRDERSWAQLAGNYDTVYECAMRRCGERGPTPSTPARWEAC